MYQRNDVREGMTVRSMDGEKLGKVFAVNEDEFLIEKGLFFPKDYVCRYAEISHLEDGEIILTHGKEGLHRFSFDGTRDSDVMAGTGGGAGVGPGALGLESRREVGTQDEVAIPVHGERLDVVKRSTQAGEVRVHKDVVVEEQHVTVPVRRERVTVERRAVQDRPAMNASFQEETVVVPLRAEEVEVRKRPVLEEEVVIRKQAVEEERDIDETVRRERVDIDGAEDSRKLGLNSDDPLLRR
ncbi:conserved domain-containing protein [Stigmatella aurantiaca]|uniref:Conserved domain-containing protein n=1 Tax=Stigmatella aurantiaca TaxID=41 RepID=A0A1H7NUT1_STIAU|nr:YsnF/AvaK domain-containing protein [Stigmatella aurantiaca]SEL26637.1 conserved domain-containing protein [Stigmatella aurantiaca]